jgi:hypothetical protein
MILCADTLYAWRTSFYWRETTYLNISGNVTWQEISVTGSNLQAVLHLWLIQLFTRAHSFGRVCFFAQDLVSHAATLNSGQSKQIVDACDYLWLSYWRSMAYSTSCSSCWRSMAHSTSCRRAITLFTLWGLMVDFNMRTPSSICQCMLSSCTRRKVVGCTLAIKHTRSKVLKRANGCTLSKRTRSKHKTVLPIFGILDQNFLNDCTHILCAPSSLYSKYPSDITCNLNYQTYNSIAAVGLQAVCPAVRKFSPKVLKIFS